MSVPTETIEKLSTVLHWLASRVQATIDLSYLNLAWLPHQRHSQRGQKYPRRLRSSPLVLSIQLANLKAALGDLDHLERIISLNG